MYNDKQLTAAIKNAATVERLAQLTHTCPLNHIHIATMFVKVINLTKSTVQSGASAGVMSKERLQSLQVQQQLTAHLQQVLLATQCAGHVCRGLANIIWALGKLQPEPEVLSMLLQRFFSQLSSAVPQDIANVLWGIAQIVRDRRLAPASSHQQRLVDTTTAPAQLGQPVVPAPGLMQPVISPTPIATDSTEMSASEAASAQGHPPGLERVLSAATASQAEQATSVLVAQQPVLSVAEVKQLLQHLVGTLHQAAPQTISNIACALCVLQHCHQWCMCTCLDEIQQIMTAFCKRISDALPSHVQKVVKCLTQLSLACSAHARQAWTRWQPPLLQTILNHVVAQHSTLKQFHIVSLLRDITQLSCLFLSADAAAELTGMSASMPASQGQQQEQRQLLAASAAAAALDGALDLHGRGFSADELDDEALSLMHTDLFGSIKVSQGVVSKNPLQTAGSGGMLNIAPDSPVSKLVHRLVAEIFSSVTRQHGAVGAGSSMAAGVSAAGQQESEQELVGVCQQSSSTASVFSSSEAQLTAVPASHKGTDADESVLAPAALSMPAAVWSEATGRSAHLALLDKLMPQLEELGILDQFSALKTLCAQHGPLESGLVGPASGAVFMQPRDRTMHNRLHSSSDQLVTSRMDGSTTLPWQPQQHMQQSAGQVQRYWGNTRPQHGQGFAGTQAGQLNSSLTGLPHQSRHVDNRSGTMANAGAAGSYVPPAGGVGRVYLQHQPWQRSVVSVQSPSTAQFPGSRFSQEAATWRQQQHIPHQYRHPVGITPHAAAHRVDVDVIDSVPPSPFQHAASLAGSGVGAPGAGAANAVKIGASFSSDLAVPMASLSSSSSASIIAGISGLSIGSSTCSSGLPSGQVGSGSIVSVLGSATGSTALSNTVLGPGTGLLGVAGDKLPAFAHGGQQQQPLPESQLMLAGGVGANQQQLLATHSASASGIATGVSQCTATPTSRQQAAVGAPMVVVQHAGHSLAYHQLADGTLVPVQAQTMPHTAHVAQMQQQQQQQQQLLLSTVPGMAAGISPAGPTDAMAAAVPHGHVQQHASGGVAMGPGVGTGYMQMQQLQSVCTAAGNSPQVVGPHQDLVLQGTASPIPADAASLLAANQIVLQQQQQQLQQQHLQIQLQQEQLRLASGQGSQFSGTCLQYLGGSLAPSSSEMAVNMGSGMLGHSTLLMNAEAAQLGSAQGQQCQLYPSQQLLQQQQMYHVPSSTGLQ